MGRPPKKISREHFTATVDPSTVDRIDALASELGLSRGRVVDEAISRLRSIVDERGGIALLATATTAGKPT